jgi:hypothetical protein
MKKNRDMKSMRKKMQQLADNDGGPNYRVRNSTVSGVHHFLGTRER